MRRFFDSHSHILLGVCGLEPEYNVPLLIDVLSPVRKLFSGAGLVLIGSGSLRGEIESQIAQSPCASNILLCGDLPHAVTLRAIAESSVLLRPTRYDGDSIAVREALHFRTPVIASDNSPRPPGVHVVSLEDLPALIAVIENVLRSPRTSITVPEALGVNDNLERILKVYASIMSGERRAQ